MDEEGRRTREVNASVSSVQTSGGEGGSDRAGVQSDGQARVQACRLSVEHPLCSRCSGDG